MKKRDWILILALACLMLGMIIFIVIFFVLPFFLPFSNGEEKIIKIINTTGLSLMGATLMFFITFLISIIRKPLTDDERKYYKGLLF